MLLVLMLLAAVATAFAFHKGVARQGIVESGKLVLQMGPVLLVAFVLAGMFSVLISPQVISDWMGRDTGLRGLLVGLGWRFVVVRYIASLAAPIVIGFLAQMLSTKLR